MPELPEVETVRRTLLPKLAGHTLTGAEVFWPKVVRYPDLEAFREGVKGREITDVRREGKHLILVLAGDRFLVVHLRMTGQLLYRDAADVPDKYTTVVLRLDRGKALHFRDVRKFGVMHLVCADEWDRVGSLRGLGREPLAPEFTPEYLAGVLAKGKGALKARLLDQTKIAGLGNIYVDEALHRAGLHPTRPAGSLTPGEVSRLHAAIQAVIAEGIAHRGTSVRDYVDGDGRAGNFQEHLLVYQRKGEPCRRCGAPIQRTVVAGRGTFYCPVCQGETGTSPKGRE